LTASTLAAPHRRNAGAGGSSGSNLAAIKAQLAGVKAFLGSGLMERARREVEESVCPPAATPAAAFANPLDGDREDLSDFHTPLSESVEVPCHRTEEEEYLLPTHDVLLAEGPAAGALPVAAEASAASPVDLDKIKSSHGRLSPLDIRYGCPRRVGPVQVLRFGTC
jgi:hypothetical protein